MIDEDMFHGLDLYYTSQHVIAAGWDVDDLLYMVIYLSGV